MNNSNNNNSFKNSDFYLQVFELEMVNLFFHGVFISKSIIQVKEIVRGGRHFGTSRRHSILVGNRIHNSLCFISKMDSFQARKAQQTFWNSSWQMLQLDIICGTLGQPKQPKSPQPQPLQRRDTEFLLKCVALCKILKVVWYDF